MARPNKLANPNSLHKLFQVSCVSSYFVDNPLNMYQAGVEPISGNQILVGVASAPQ